MGLNNSGLIKSDRPAFRFGAVVLSAETYKPLTVFCCVCFSRSRVVGAGDKLVAAQEVLLLLLLSGQLLRWSAP